MTGKPNQPPSRACARGRDQMGMGINNNTSAYSTLRSRARVKDRFYDPAIASDSRYLLPPCDFDDMLVEASDEAMERICTKNEKIRADAERRLDANRPPLWLGLFRIAAKAQKGKARKVLNALKQDSRHVMAAEIAGIPIRTFYRILKKVQSDFALCLQAYHEHLKE